MKRYAEYKDSGIEWIGEIPKDWSLINIGQLYQERNEKVSDTEYAPLSVTKNGIVPQLEIAAKSDNGDNRKLVRVGDFVINSRSDRRGSCGISEMNGSVSLINTVLFPNQAMDTAYYSFLFRSEGFADEFYRWGKGIVNDLWSTKWSNMKHITVPFPSVEEQYRISDFLSTKTIAVDVLISEKQKLIELLKEKAQSIISEAVTKGLDRNAKMKDSGIEWIGEIPEHWEVLPLFAVANENQQKNTSLVNNNLLSLSYGKIINKDIETNFGLLPESFETYQIIEKGYTILRLTDLQNDKRSLRSGYVPEKGIITSAYVGLIPSEKVNDKYLSDLLHAYDLIKIFYGLGNGVRQSMNYKDLKRMPLPVPPVHEQKRISEYLAEKTAKVDTPITDIQSQIEKLKEYRQSIISEAVTGKVAI